jgi:hypothetical protein
MAQEGTSCELLGSSLNRAELPTFRALDALLELESTSPACCVRGEHE